MEKDINQNEIKVLRIKDNLNVLEFNKNELFMYFNAEVIFNSELKFQNVSISIERIEIYDNLNLKTLNCLELKNHIFSLFSKLQNFFEVKIKNFY